MISVTICIIILSVAASFYAWSNQTVFANWLFVPAYIKRYKQYWRFLTSGFIHADYYHLFFNMLSFYYAGESLEGFFKSNFGYEKGILFYLGLYLGGIIVADLPTYFKNQNNSQYPGSLGASGAVSAVLFAIMLFNPWAEVRVFFAIPMPFIVFAALYVAFSIYMSKRNLDNVNHDAHLYGALYGVVYMAVVVPEIIPHFFNQLTSF
jgi:membrane associated rhomboid family serine protease